MRDISSSTEQPFKIENLSILLIGLSSSELSCMIQSIYAVCVSRKDFRKRSFHGNSNLLQALLIFIFQLHS